jgi:hypothetical protein
MHSNNRQQRRYSELGLAYPTRARFSGQLPIPNIPQPPRLVIHHSAKVEEMALQKMRTFIESADTRKDARRRRLNRWLQPQLKCMADPAPEGPTVFCGEAFHRFYKHQFVYGAKESLTAGIGHYIQLVSLLPPNLDANS